MSINVIGAGLAGCEAAWQIATRGVEVSLFEMKPRKFTPAHRNKNFAEHVCSNSLKAERISTSQLSTFIIDRKDEILKENMMQICSEFIEKVGEYNHE